MSSLAIPSPRLEPVFQRFVTRQQSGMEKAFIFHFPTKLYIGTDSSPVDSKTHEICSDFIDLCVDFGGLYG
jgi:Ras-related GTP-binding protein C/D